MSIVMCTCIPSQQGECSTTCKPPNGGMSGIVKISAGDEQELLEAVATMGPVAAAVDATSYAFRVRRQLYTHASITST